MPFALKFLGLIIASVTSVLCGMPRMPHMNCAHSFAGSPESKACFDKFNEDMAAFHSQMQAYNGQGITQIHQSASTDGNSDSMTVLSNHAFSSSQNGRHTSTFSSQGYTVKTSGISVSSVKQNSTMTIILAIGPFDNFQTQTEGNLVSIDVKTKAGVEKQASLKLPKGVTPENLKIEKSEDKIMITGPIKSRGGGGVSNSQISYSSFVTEI